MDQTPPAAMPSGCPTLLSLHTLLSGGRLRTQVWMEPALVLSGSIAVPFSSLRLVGYLIMGLFGW